MNNIPTIWIQKRDGEYFCHCPFCHYEHYSGLERSPPVIKAKTPEGYLKKCATTGNEYIIRIGEPELPTVWAEETHNPNDFYYRANCPSCKSNNLRFGKESHYLYGKNSHKCANCGQEYFISRPAPEQFKAGDRLQSVQWWPTLEDGKPFITEVEVAFNELRNELCFYDHPGGRHCITVSRYTDKTYLAKHFSLHTTYEDALRTVAPLWEADGTELWIAFRSGCELIYKAFEAKFKKGTCYFKDSDNENWGYAPLKELDKDSHCQSATTRVYIGPDRDAAERICREKNGDNLLDERLPIESIIKKVERDNRFLEIGGFVQWVWDWGTQHGRFPTLREVLLNHKSGAQWIVDNFADTLDPKIIAALSAKLKKA